MNEKISNKVLVIAICPIYLLIAIFAFFFISIATVDASTGSINSKDIKSIKEMYAYNCSSANNCTSKINTLNYRTNYNYGTGSGYFELGTIVDFSSNDPGVNLRISTDQGFIAGNYYSMTLYVAGKKVGDSVTPSRNLYFRYTTGIGTGVTESSAYSNRSTSNFLDYNVIQNIPLYFGLGDTGSYHNINVITFIFRASHNGNFVSFAIGPASAISLNMLIYGYNVDFIGTDISSVISSLNKTNSELKSQIIDSQNQNKNDIINNQDNNKNDIINNQDQNKQDIIDNNDKNNKETQDTINNNFNECRNSRNLFNYNYGSKTINGVTFSYDEETNELVLNGSPVTNYTSYLSISNAQLSNILLDKKTYTFSTYPRTNKVVLQLSETDKNSNTTRYLNTWNKNFTYTMDYEKYTYRLIIQTNDIVNSGVFENYRIKFQIEEGSVATDIEPFGQICKNRIDETNDKLNETNNYLKDDTAPDADISSLGNVTGLLPPGPLDSLLNIPFQFLSIVISSFGDVCVPLSGKFVFDSTLTLPCFSDSFYSQVPSSLMVFINLIPTTFLLIKYFKFLYKKVERATSLETNSDDEWGCI